MKRLFGFTIRKGRLGLLLSLLWTGLYLGGISKPAEAEPAMMRVTNHSKPTVCAEDDNVDLRFSGSIKQLLIKAIPPAYMGLIGRDQTAPDFTDCVIKDAPPEEGAAINKVVLYEDQQYQLVGFLKTGGFWRKSEVDVQVGERHVTHLELLQWHVKRHDQFYEFLVLYPSDGYWRLRLLPQDPLPATAYGTSFLVGPIEQGARPFVALKQVVFDPQNKAFKLFFAKGGEAVLKLEALSPADVTLAVTFNRKLDSSRPFLAMRSMFVRDDNADSSHVALKTKGASAWQMQPVMTYRGGSASTVWLGRLVPSRHNTSAPDMQIEPLR